MISYEGAKKYIQNGFSIFPVDLTKDEKGKWVKKPAVPWKEYQTRLATDEELHQWFDSQKHNGLGLATGKISGVVVLDVESTAKEEDVVGLNSNIISKTISGGKHFYYKWNHEIRNTVKIRNKAIDFRGDGGYVVLPPSSSESAEYSWYKWKGQIADLSPLPESIEKNLTASREISIIKAPTSDKELFSQAGLGERNQKAAQITGAIIVRMSRKFWNPYGWLILKDWNEKNEEPLSERELKITWDSINRSDFRNHPFRLDTGEQYKIYSGQAALEHYKILQEKYGSGLSTGFNILDGYFTFLPEQLYLISASTHSGKTMFALNMASRMAKSGKKVLFASLEQGVFITQFVEKMLGSTYPDSLMVLTSDKLISTQGLIEAVTSMEIRPDILFIDHLHFIQKKGNGATEDIDEMMIDIQNMAKTLTMPVVVIAHVRKLNADRPPEMDDLRNSSSLAQVPSVVLFLYRKKSSDTDIENTYLEKRGYLYIAKNRIQGKTGRLSFELNDLGQIAFDFDTTPPLTMFEEAESTSNGENSQLWNMAVDVFHAKDMGDELPF